MKIKRCKKCGKKKLLSDFSKTGLYYCTKCKECLRKEHLEKTYNLTFKEYKKLFLKQKGKCAICGKYENETKRGFVPDHNHITGKVRGLLCEGCNAGLGVFRGDDGAEILEKAIEYIRKSGVLI